MNTDSNLFPSLFNFHIVFCFFLLTLISLLFINISNVNSAQVTLAWNDNSSAEIDGYKVYYGTTSQSYGVDPVGNVDKQTTTYTVTGLDEGVTYYFAVTAYYINNESDFSDEVSYFVPITPGDADGDGIPDDVDECPYDPENDVDNDGICGDADNCPSTYNPNQTDLDNDGTGHACDTCPSDPYKSEPGICGCGTPDTDNDSDGTPDCNDTCPSDPYKTEPGNCGCGTADTDCGNPDNDGEEEEGGGGGGGGGGSTGENSQPPETVDETPDIDLNPEPDCENNADCSNGVFCDGEEKCIDNRCTYGLLPCTEDETCVEEDETCIFSDSSSECESDSDCDDGNYCNGEESCVDGACYAGEVPCDEGYECSEETYECEYNDTDTQSVSVFIKKGRKPVYRLKSCQWIIMKYDEDIDLSNTTITIESSDNNYHGVEIDDTRNPVKMGTLIFIPVCIWKDATSGEWTVVIETGMADSYNAAQGLIEAGFRVY